jgi:hypothetical protein
VDWYSSGAPPTSNDPVVHDPAVAGLRGDSPVVMGGTSEF